MLKKGSASDFEALLRRKEEIASPSTKLVYLRGANAGLVMRDGNLSSNNTECDTREVEFLGFRDRQVKPLPPQREGVESPPKKSRTG